MLFLCKHRQPQSNLAHSRNQRRIRKEAQCINKDPDPSGPFRLLSEAQGVFGLSSRLFSPMKESRASGWRSVASLTIFCQRGSFPSSLLFSLSTSTLVPVLCNLTNIMNILKTNIIFVKDVLKCQPFGMVKAHLSWLCPQIFGKVKEKLKKSTLSLSVSSGSVYSLLL